jgi:hypothetical protein
MYRKLGILVRYLATLVQEFGSTSVTRLQRTISVNCMAVVTFIIQDLRFLCTGQNLVNLFQKYPVTPASTIKIILLIAIIIYR